MLAAVPRFLHRCRNCAGELGHLAVYTNLAFVLRKETFENVLISSSGWTTKVVQKNRCVTCYNSSLLVRRHTIGNQVSLRATTVE